MITLDTVIRDPYWRKAYVTYVSTGRKVKVDYEVDKSGVYIAQKIAVLNKERGEKR